ncbi:MAG: BatA domain-containing protein, partial [Verrucomicrobiota bacterium]
MAFLSTGMLYGLGALLVPVIIHLWRQRRVVQVRFSTLRFLKIAAARTSRSSRIENVLLLFLRCLLFALLVLAAARPVLSSGGARLFGGDVPRTVVLAIDNSMSMSCRVNGTTRL